MLRERSGPNRSTLPPRDVATPGYALRYECASSIGSIDATSVGAGFDSSMALQNTIGTGQRGPVPFIGWNARQVAYDVSLEMFPRN